MEKQTDLDGKPVEDEDLLGYEDMGLIKSCLQKTIRRGMTESAMYWALRLAEVSSWSCWKRLSVIADEDVGQPEVITAVDVLYRKFMALKKEAKKGELSWDMKRCVVCAAKILVESEKDRRSDEFLELMEAIGKHGKDEQLQKIKSELEAIPDEALDMHTLQGRRMGRGDLYWYEVSSETANKTSEYEAWHNWFNPLMIRLVKERKK